MAHNGPRYVCCVFEPLCWPGRPSCSLLSPGPGHTETALNNFPVLRAYWTPTRRRQNQPWATTWRFTGWECDRSRSTTADSGKAKAVARWPPSVGWSDVCLFVNFKCIFLSNQWSIFKFVWTTALLTTLQ